MASSTHLGDAPELAGLIGSVKTMIDAYEEGRIDRLYVVYNRFVNTMTQEPNVRQLLPVAKGELEDAALGSNWDYLYEPDAEEVLNGLMTRYLESQVYQVLSKTTLVASRTDDRDESRDRQCGRPDS